MCKESLTPEQLTAAITSTISEFRSHGWLPNGAQQLASGSALYRREAEFNAHAAGLNSYRGDPGYDSAWQAWRDTYQPYSSSNLVATAAYQHRRYHPDEPGFPDQDTEAFVHLTESMGELGSLFTEFEARLDREQLFQLLTRLDLLAAGLNPDELT